MSQGNNGSPGVQISVGNIRITGAPADTRPSDLGAALQRGLERALASPLETRVAQRSLDVPNLRLRVAAEASEAEIAATLASAIRARLRREAS